MTDDPEFISLRMHGTTALITLDRAPVNAVSQAMYEQLRDTFGRFDEVLPDAKTVVLTGAGKHFCAGNDLDQFLTLDARNSAGRMRLVRDAFNSVYDCPVPVIAAVRGAALGTGLAIAACCDVIVAGESATFGTPEVGVGVMGGARHLARVVPEHFMRLLYFTADPVPASELLRFGSVARIVPDADVVDVALEVAARMSRHSRVALRHAKASLNATEFLPLKAAYEFEQSMTGRLVATRDAKEAVSAVRARRAPKYTDDLA